MKVITEILSNIEELALRTKYYISYFNNAGLTKFSHLLYKQYKNLVYAEDKIYRKIKKLDKNIKPKSEHFYAINGLNFWEGIFIDLAQENDNLSNKLIKLLDSIELKLDQTSYSFFAEMIIHHKQNAKELRDILSHEFVTREIVNNI